MKVVLLIIGVTLFIIGIQDAIRLVFDNNQISMLSFIPGETSLYIGLDIVLAVGGAVIARMVSKAKKSSSK